MGWGRLTYLLVRELVYIVPRWREDLGEALDAFVQHFEKSVPHAARIVHVIEVLGLSLALRKPFEYGMPVDVETLPDV